MDDGLETPRPARIQDWLRTRGAVGAIIALTCALYAPGMRTSYFADDFHFFFPHPTDLILTEFVRPNPYLPYFWRPVQSTLLALQQYYFGWETWPCHLLQLAMHCALVALVYRLAKEIRGNTAQALLAAMFCAVAHVGVQTVVQIDVLSQGGSTLCMALAGWAMFRATHGLTSTPAYADPKYIGSVVCFAVSLLMKETGSAGLPILAFLIAVPAFRASRSALIRQGFRRLLVGLAPLIAVFVVYFLWRAAIVETQSLKDRYGFNFGANMVTNLVGQFAANAVPLSPHSVFLWHHFGNTGLLVLVGILTSSLWAGVVVGLRLVPRSTWVGLVVVAVFSTLPVALLAHPTEVYAYNMLPAVSLLFGLALGAELTEGMKRQRFAPVWLAASVAVVMLVAQAWAVREKTELIVGNGLAGRALYPQLLAAVRDAPPDSTVLLVNPPSTSPAYSVILVPGFGVLSSAPRVIVKEARRPDIRINVTDSAPESLPKGTVAYTLSNGRLVPYAVQVPR